MLLLEISQILCNLGEFVGSIAVLGTLFYLVVQIRQNMRAIDESRVAARGQVYQSRFREGPANPRHLRLRRGQQTAVQTMGPPSEGSASASAFGLRRMLTQISRRKH